MITLARHVGAWRTRIHGYAKPMVSSLVIGCFLGAGPLQAKALVLCIYDWKTQRVYVEAQASTGSRLLFSWVHSQEKIPWNEYYHVGVDRQLVLDTITFPAFGAGIPEDKGGVTYIRNGLIYMDEIGQPFAELVWLNSHAATRELVLDGVFLTRGDALPDHTRLRLVIKKTNKDGCNDGNE